jgi:hypothetical protein
MPFWVPPCDKCFRTTKEDDADVQVIGWHKEFCNDIGDEYEEADYMCKDCRIKFNKTAVTSYKKEDIGKRDTIVINAGREIEFHND